MPRPIAALLLTAASAFAQSVPALTVSGALVTPVSISASDLAAMEHITATYHEGGKAIPYSGVPLEAILKKAGAPLNTPHGGQTMRLAVRATARDGYQVVYALAEFDSTVIADRPIVADQSEGKPLADKVGPFRVVMPNEKKGARCIRMLEKLELIDLSSSSK